MFNDLARLAIYTANTSLNRRSCWYCRPSRLSPLYEQRHMGTLWACMYRGSTIPPEWRFTQWEEHSCRPVASIRVSVPRRSRVTQHARRFPMDCCFSLVHTSHFVAVRSSGTEISHRV